ncbi:hypothetical protein F383_10575 [Gossypium arboreum]|uniref:Uncharacterized protein n=1 Tax=Gossypium arboreum TaxID=29729 RepID=A0A0B0PEB3_GOSAR|nr:hypothetical protein F383_02086 [Gossypium arboreum]KHG23267.1 hypothetical protein F383_10575 [Gossypium arboreum]
MTIALIRSNLNC